MAGCTAEAAALLAAALAPRPQSMNINSRFLHSASEPEALLSFHVARGSVNPCSTSAAAQPSPSTPAAEELPQCRASLKAPRRTTAENKQLAAVPSPGYYAQPSTVDASSLRRGDLPATESDQEASSTAQWLNETLQRVHPDAQITQDSLCMLSGLFEELISKVVAEAQLLTETAEPLEGAAGSRTSRKRRVVQDLPLTSLQIQKAVRKVLPGDPGLPLRPYLPAVTKQAWHLDKVSLRGIKKKQCND